jgi:hypothetical protein
MAQTWQQISTFNQYQNLGQSNYEGFMNNFSFEPTVEELNRTAKFGGEISIQESVSQDVLDEPLFGTHIREAVTTITKLLR